MLNGLLHCYNIYPTKDDRYMVLAALEYKFWDRFCAAVRRDDLRKKHMVLGEESSEMFSELENLFSSKTQLEWIDYFKGVDCCVTPVLNIHEAVSNEQTVARNMTLKNKDPNEVVKRALFEFRCLSAVYKDDGQSATNLRFQNLKSE